MKKKGKFQPGQIALHIIFILLCVSYIVPVWLLISVSFEGDRSVGFNLIPRVFSTFAYEMILAAPQRILRAYGVTFFYAISSVILSLLVMVPMSYALSRRDFLFRRFITFLVFFTTLFSGGRVPSYLLNSSLGLVNTIWIYILPGLVSAWNVIVIRTYFQGLPGELFECARLDGASELRTCFSIAVPLSTPVLATVGFFRFIGEWNNYTTSEIYIRDPKLYSLQYLMKMILNDLALIKEMMEKGMADMDESLLENTEAARFAMAVVAVLPSLFVFPYFQKYFKKGMTIGSVKG